MPGRQDDIRSFLADQADCVLVEISKVSGSTPRDSDAWMLVGANRIFRTIGGGQLEFMAIDQARRLRAGGEVSLTEVPLGPEIGQCCGGRVHLRYQPLDQLLAAALIARIDGELAARPQVYIFGAGHVGDALALALSLTPLQVVLVDTRADELAEVAIPGVKNCLTAMPEQIVRSAPAGSAFLILTHDHALDFLIASEALSRGDAAYVGMIGSKTKKATFRNWLKRETGSDGLFEALICPIGGSAVKDKRPEVIAALATAEVLTALFARQQD